MRRIVSLVAGSVVVFLALTACSSEIRPPSFDTTSDAKLEAQSRADSQRALDTLLAQFPEADVPTVERVRFVELDEWAVVTASCLTDEGFYAEATSNGLSSSADPGQEQELAVATYVCALKYPTNPRTNIPLNDDQKRFLYEYYTRVLTPCVEAEGFQVPPPPTQQSYIETYGNEGSWNPYALVAEATGGEEEWLRINALCPQVPPGLYGSNEDVKHF